MMLTEGMLAYQGVSKKVNQRARNYKLLDASSTNQNNSLERTFDDQVSVKTMKIKEKR